MSKITAKARFYVENDLKIGQEVIFEDNAGHYLVNVLRAQLKDYITLFNGRHGDWLAEIVKVGNGKALVVVTQNTAPQRTEPDLWYLFAPIKKAPLDYMVQKATELGVSMIQPVLTERTNLDGFNEDKMRTNVIEAAEQFERMTVPAVLPLIKLEQLLKTWPDDRWIMFCEEEGAHDKTVLPVGPAIMAANAPEGRSKGGWPIKWAILIGPEGGFSKQEREMIRGHRNVVPVTLGPRILRADTAAIVAIALLQSFVEN